MRPAVRSVAALALCSALLPSCATQAGGTSVAAPVEDRNILSREEILRGEYQTAYDAVLARRRTWLIERTDRMRESTPTQVYIDEMRVGGLEELRQIPIARVARIRYYDGTAAYARWGLGHDRGAIQVITAVRDDARP